MSTARDNKGRPYALAARVRAGCRLIPDSDFPCLSADRSYLVQEGLDKQLYIECVHGAHDLAGQLDNLDGDVENYYIGLYLEEPNFIDDIRAFHEKFNLTYDGPPRQLPDDLKGFRERFLLEEVQEYVLAVTQEDRLDALVDLMYVLLGTAYLHGFDFSEAWRRVHRANMSKVRAYSADDSKRNSTHDVVKPQGWVAPDHSDLV